MPLEESLNLNPDIKPDRKPKNLLNRKVPDYVKYFVLAIVLLLFFVTLVLNRDLLYYRTIHPVSMRLFGLKNPDYITPMPTSIPSPTTLHLPPPFTAEYRSTKLGIEIHYRPKHLGESEARIEEKGNKIFYMYKSVDGQWRSEQYIEVLSKSPTDTIAEALTKRFLIGQARNYCSVELGTRSVERWYPPNTTYQTAMLIYKGNPGYGSDEFTKVEGKCPGPYTLVNYAAHFLTDSKHPDKLLFINNGQDGASSGIPYISYSKDKKRSWLNGYSWDETIQFLDK